MAATSCWRGCNGSYLPAMLQRRGYLWAANMQNVMTAERERGIYQRLAHTEDSAVPGGGRYLLLFGAESPYAFVDDPTSQLRMAGKGLELYHPIDEPGSPHPNPSPFGELRTQPRGRGVRRGGRDAAADGGAPPV